MNKMAKGALAIGIGSALLLGGGGTLAVWNDTETSASGTITAGDLNLANTTDGAGKWTNAKNEEVNINTYKVVPGDVLTYTQKMQMTLAGETMQAKLTMTGGNIIKSTFGSEVDVVPPTITKADNTEIKADTVLTKDDSGVVTAKATFIFKNVANSNAAKNASASFDAVQFRLDQMAPGTTK
ncbi:alternate-type signal peptide domain-containing protein [Arthrobacter sp. zg-Y238]|uniref:alternate-type signal peptide domain-containing protein n=1 Tax=Arthrobacter sp. zg-Y238 TaxID=2964614 RepID=UPI0021085740|nr:alternate-type signal peptide domain-containing protein [Arthrobacter sp. zg-Y238]MCQ1954403.1 alternate-type signal peptide domain-containing protein [Arthrobacter sp. zg-Y238]